MDTSQIEVTEEDLQKLSEVAGAECSTISECWGTLLNKPVSVVAESSAVVVTDDFITMMEFPLIITRVSFAGDVLGDSYYVFSEVDALTVSGLLMMMGDEEIAEKRKSSYELDDADAFKEAINVMLGNIGIALRDHQEKDLSLSQQFQRCIIP